MTPVAEPDFDAWYVEQRPRVYLSMLAIGGSADLAADATDEAFTRAVAHWKRVRAMDSPGGWTQRVAMNVLKRRLRRRSVENRLLRRSVPQDHEAAPAGEVWDVVRALPERQRIAVVLRYVADLTEPEIAAVMGVARGTVASTLASARERLGQQLRSELEEEMR